MNNQLLYFNYKENSHYPENNPEYNPHIFYPEYPWSAHDISDDPNDVYEMLRESFYSLGYDRENFNTPHWNPLGKFIKQGQTVLLKPNWVAHENKHYFSDETLSCMVTHPSLVRAIIDYVIIALKGEGSIILGDAPMQGTIIEEVWRKAGYLPLFDFIKQKNIPITISDFRKYRTEQTSSVRTSPIPVDNPFGGTTVDINQHSKHAEKDSLHPKYKVSDYTENLTAQYHASGTHRYEISNAALLADVIINIPKPKTHRLGGLTGAMKNMIGLTYEKACLPHRTRGDKQTNKGDEFYKKSLLKNAMSYFDNLQTIYSNNRSLKRAWLCNFFKKAFYVLGSYTSKDNYRIGSWHGNDTIWRTIHDVNFIINYADKKGSIQSCQQRTLLHIGDMIISGEKEGPVGPSPKKLGAIMISENDILFDFMLCKVMGFSPDKIPSVKQALIENPHLLTSRLASNIFDLNEREINSILTPVTWHFEPHSSWKGNIES